MMMKVGGTSGRVIEKKDRSQGSRSPLYAHHTFECPFVPASTMLPGSKRRALTTDDLMHRQELGSRKRQKRIRDEDDDSLQGSDGPVSGEDSQPGGFSALDEGEDDGDPPSETPISNGEDDDTIPSRFSFKPRQGTISEKTAVSSHTPSLPSTFTELGVSLSLVSAMNSMSIRTPTEIQVACIPPLLDGMYFLLRSRVPNVECPGKVEIVSGMQRLVQEKPLLSQFQYYSGFPLILTASSPWSSHPRGGYYRPAGPCA